MRTTDNRTMPATKRNYRVIARGNGFITVMWDGGTVTTHSI